MKDQSKSMLSMPTAAQKTVFILAVIICLFPFVNGPIALVGGFLISLLIGHPFRSLNQKAVNWLLKIAVVGLGFGINADEAMKAGKEGFLLTISTICLTLILGYFIGRLFKVPGKTTYLISSGTAICGGSAIAAVSPVINASEKDISVSLGVVFLLNSVALLVFPPIGGFLELSQTQFGLFSAIAIHDTSSVVGAAHAYGSDALKVATTVKLARALWIIPLALISVLLFRGKGKPVKIPWFIFLFVVAILVNSYTSLPDILTKSVVISSKALLVLTLFLIGAGLSLQKIKDAGWKPMLLGVSLWIIISVGALLAITTDSLFS